MLLLLLTAVKAGFLPVLDELADVSWPPRFCPYELAFNELLLHFAIIVSTRFLSVVNFIPLSKAVNGKWNSVFSNKQQQNSDYCSS